MIRWRYMVDRLCLLAVHAHPDDESICTGGALARYAAEGVRTVLVCCTRGEEGGVHDPRVSADEARRRLGGIRERELREAAAALGVHEVHVLPYRDSGMAGTATNADPRSFINADPHDVAAHLAAIVRRERPQVVITYDEGGGYGHPDHRMTYRVTRLALAGTGIDDEGPVAKLYYPAVARSALRRANERMRARGLAEPFDDKRHASDIRQLVAPDDLITARIDVAAYRDRVDRALRAHRTQLSDDDVLLTLPADIAGEAFGVECYIRAFTRVQAPEQECDLYAGLR